MTLPEVLLVSTPDPQLVPAPESPSRDCSPIPPGRLWDIIEKTAIEEGLDPQLITLVIEKESRFRPCAVSSNGALGLMQLMPETAADFGVTDPFDPRESIPAGAKVLAGLLRRYEGNLALALGAYNAGPGAIDRHGGLPPFPETLQYVSGITASLAQ